jgi:hypothetical protein
MSSLIFKSKVAMSLKAAQRLPRLPEVPEGQDTDNIFEKNKDRFIYNPLIICDKLESIIQWDQVAIQEGDIVEIIFTPRVFNFKSNDQRQVRVSKNELIKIRILETYSFSIDTEDTISKNIFEDDINGILVVKGPQF